MANTVRIDLVSDTATKPGKGMLQAMAAAETADEQRGEDPTTNALCERVADMLGHEAAVLLPSGIMANLIAVVTQCRAGDEMVCAADAHVANSEAGGAAVIGGVSLSAIPTERGFYSADQLRVRVRAKKARAPRTRLAHIEQTTNRGGGAVWPLEDVKAIATVAHDTGMVVHMDGARLFNASVASGIPVGDFAAPCDTVWIDLSKGLGGPFGSVLAGSHAFIEDAWIWKQRLGGAMRQSGVLAAAGLYALDNNVERLAEDHANARTFAERIATIPGVVLDPETVETNLVFFDVSRTGVSAKEIASRLLARGIRIGAESDRRMRAVTHLDVSMADVVEAADALAAALADKAA